MDMFSDTCSDKVSIGTGFFRLFAFKPVSWDGYASFHTGTLVMGLIPVLGAFSLVSENSTLFSTIFYIVAVVLSLVLGVLFFEGWMRLKRRAVSIWFVLNVALMSSYIVVAMIPVGVVLRSLSEEFAFYVQLSLLSYAGFVFVYAVSCPVGVKLWYAVLGIVVSALPVFLVALFFHDMFVYLNWM